MDIFWKLRDFFSAHWRAYAAAAVLLSIVAVLNLLPPAIVGWVVDGIVAGSLRRRELILYVTAIVGCALAVYICRYQWRRILYGASYRLSLELRHRIYRHLLQLSPEDLRAFSTGDLMARATNDVQAVEMCAGEAVLSIFDGLLTGVLVLAVMVFTLSGWLTLMALAPWPLMSWAMWRLGTLLHRRFDVAQSTFSAFNSVTEESIAGIRALRGLSAEPHALRIFAQASDTANEASLDVARIDARYEPIIYLTVGASFLISVSAGAWLIEHGQLSVGELTSFTIYLGHLVWPMFAFGWMANLVQRGKAGWNRVQDFLQARPVIADDGEETETGDNALDVAITRFNYRGRDEPVLQDLRFRLLAGETLGVVGPTGSGKSTLLNLIARFYESQGVQIRLGQKPLAAYRLDALRSAFNYVVQEGLLFSASIRENLLLACPDADESRLLAALGTAALDRDLAGFADGMETLIGERGISLSGGQRQRLCLARALLTDAPILLLDDPLSAVDVETEKLVLAALRRHAPEQARVIVSHRLSAVREADEILVLREGRIAERGNHHTLLALDGWYARTWRYQQLVADKVEAR